MLWHQYLLAAVFVIAGVLHFVIPKFYERITPRYIPARKVMVYVSGVLEVISGIFLLTTAFQKIGAWAIIVLLILFFSVHIFMLQDEKARMKAPKWVLVLRLLLQFILIYWAYLYI